MKSKKLSILNEGMKHINEEVQNKPKQSLNKTISVNFTFCDNIVTATTIQYTRLQSLFP